MIVIATHEMRRQINKAKGIVSDVKYEKGSGQVVEQK